MKFFYTLILFVQIVFAQNITISDINIDKEGYGLPKIQKENLFEPYRKESVNLGHISNPIFMKLTLSNDSNETIERILSPTDPRFDVFKLYDEHHLLCSNNVFSEDGPKATLPYCTIELKPHSQNIYYLKVASLYGSLNFHLHIQKPADFFKSDLSRQRIIILFVGVLIAFIFYGIMLYLYSQKRTYLYYSIYLIVFIYHQIWYLGLTYLFLPQSTILLYAKTMIIQVSALIITFAFFIMNFLKLKNFPYIKKTYYFFIIVAAFEAIALSVMPHYGPDIVIATGAIFILFNNIIGIYAYWNGVREAKYFIIGYGIATIAFFVIILDFFGFTSITQSYPYIILIATSIEALVFLLAFFEKHSLLQEEHTEAKVIRRELELQKLYTREIHHRVKNNLEMILSIIDLQSSDAKDKSKFEDLKNRIFAIAQNYTMLTGSGRGTVAMGGYIAELINSIKYSMQTDKKINMEIEVEQDIEFALDKSIYVGLIINELVVNSFKYAFGDNGGMLKISLRREGSTFVLIVEDDGKGFDPIRREGSFGLVLVETLATNDLKGEIHSFTDDCTKYIIRF